MSDDPLQDLAKANQERMQVQARRVELHYYPPPTPARRPSPFGWGFGLALGVVTALILSCFVTGFVGSCVGACNQELQRQQLQRMGR